MFLGGGPIPARLYRPVSGEVLPGLVYFHGGGWVLCGLDTHDGVCRRLANRARCIILSVDYRLAPEHPFPAAVDDSVSASTWFMQHADELGVDPARVAVGGDSAGGNLAAVVARRACDAGQPVFVEQLLIYPVTDHDFERPSMLSPGDDRVLGELDMRWFWNLYLGESGVGTHPDASPFRAKDLSGLPPAIVITAEYDPLRDDGAEYAKRLADAGVDVRYLQADGLPHGFVGMADVVHTAGEALDQLADLLAQGFRLPARADTNLGGA